MLSGVLETWELKKIVLHVPCVFKKSLHEQERQENGVLKYILRTSKLSSS